MTIHTAQTAVDEMLADNARRKAARFQYFGFDCMPKGDGLWQLTANRHANRAFRAAMGEEWGEQDLGPGLTADEVREQIDAVVKAAAGEGGLTICIECGEELPHGVDCRCGDDRPWTVAVVLPADPSVAGVITAALD